MGERVTSGDRMKVGVVKAWWCKEAWCNAMKVKVKGRGRGRDERRRRRGVSEWIEYGWMEEGGPGGGAHRSSYSWVVDWVGSIGRTGGRWVILDWLDWLACTAPGVSIGLTVEHVEPAQVPEQLDWRVQWHGGLTGRGRPSLVKLTPWSRSRQSVCRVYKVCQVCPGLSGTRSVHGRLAWPNAHNP